MSAVFLMATDTCIPTRASLGFHNSVVRSGSMPANFKESFCCDVNIEKTERPFGMVNGRGATV
jgi:hypothetical protein